MPAVGRLWPSDDDDNDDDDDLVLEKERLFAVEGFKLVNNKTR